MKRQRNDRERPERALSPQRDRIGAGDRGRFNDDNGRRRRSPSPRNDRGVGARRPNFNDNRRGGDFGSGNNRGRDNQRRDGNDRRPFVRNDDGPRLANRDRPWRDGPRRNSRDRMPARRNSRDRDGPRPRSRDGFKRTSRDRLLPRRNSRERNSRERDAPRRGSRDKDHDRRNASPPPRRDNPFRRVSESQASPSLDKHSNKVRHDERQDFRLGESRADRNDPQQRSFPKRERDSDNENYEWGGHAVAKTDAPKQEPNEEEKQKPNFGLSGKLTEDTNKVNGVVVKYAEPPEARRSKRLWRFYPFKGTESLKIIHLHRQSSYMIGRDKKLCEIPVDHPSCSKQHAVLQFRLVPYERADGSQGKHVLPYIIDLESANGTIVNDQNIETRKYVELRERDVVKFGFSTREYVLLHGDSKTGQDNDVVGGDENGNGSGTNAGGGGDDDGVPGIKSEPDDN